MNWRTLTDGALARTGLASARVRWLHRANRQQVRILAYHRVLTPAADFPFDPAVISATPAAFRRQMEFVQRHFTAITFADLARITTGECPVPPNPILITFDDGYRDNYDHAFPILREFELPACVFIVTDYIGTTRSFWWDNIAWTIHQTQELACRFRLGAADRTWPLVTDTDRQTFRLEVLRTVKQLPEEQKNRLIADLAESLQVVPEPPANLGQLMTWAEVKESAHHGIEIGSHTRTHPVLANVTEPQLRDEIEGSRRKIANQIGQAPVALAYPVGGATRYNHAVIDALRMAGYQFGVTYRGGTNDLRQWNGFELRRIAVESEHHFEQFVSRVVFPPSG